MMLVLENEVDLSYRYLVDEITRYLPEHEVYDYAREGRAPDADLSGVDGVVVGGSTAGVYERDEHPWMRDQIEFIQEAVDAEVPILGICFGHQIVNHALGGEVEHSGRRHAELVEADLGDDPLFTGVEDVVPVLHGDKVVEAGDEMEVIASADYYERFATRHRRRPVWTVQYHPEFTRRVEDQGEGWTRNHLSFDDSTATKTIENFARLAREHTGEGEAARNVA